MNLGQKDNKDHDLTLHYLSMMIFSTRVVGIT